MVAEWSFEGPGAARGAATIARDSQFHENPAPTVAFADFSAISVPNIRRERHSNLHRRHIRIGFSDPYS